MSVSKNREAEVARMRGTYAALVEVATGCRIGTPEHTSACKRLRQPERLTSRDVPWSRQLRNRGLVRELSDRTLGAYVAGLSGDPRTTLRDRTLARLQSCRQRLNALEGRPVNRGELERADRWLARHPERTRSPLERARQERQELVRQAQERLRQVIAERQRMRERAQERTRTPQRTRNKSRDAFVR